MIQVKIIRNCTYSDVEDEINRFIEDKKVIDIKPIDDDEFFSVLVIYEIEN